jgi:hypothetical protein
MTGNLSLLMAGDVFFTIIGQKQGQPMAGDEL